jgi:DNA-binding NtrC family response regulator
MRTVLSDALQQAGYLVATAPDLGTAVDRLDDMRPALLITPPYISGMPGYMGADYLGTKQPGLPVLMVSGFMKDDRINVQNAIRQFHTFPQPFTRDELLAKVRETLKSESEKRLHDAWSGTILL